LIELVQPGIERVQQTLPDDDLIDRKGGLRTVAVRMTEVLDRAGGEVVINLCGRLAGDQRADDARADRRARQQAALATSCGWRLVSRISMRADAMPRIPPPTKARIR